MKRYVVPTLLLMLGLPACGGVSQSNSGELPQAASAPIASDVGAREAPTDSVRLPAALLLPGSSGLLYVANTGNNSITVYHANASGDTAPIATIIGSNTQLNNPTQLSEDTNGNLYVANLGAQSILVFAHGANGNVAPVQAISGPLTGFSQGLFSATVDQTTRRIFAVAQVAGADGGFGDLLRFPLNANGNEAPLATSPCCSDARELASDSTGTKFIYASAGVCCETFSWGVYTTEKFPNEAHPAKRPDISNFGPGGIADDPTTKTFLVSGYDGVTYGIFRFQEDTVGTGVFDTVAFGGGSAPEPSYKPAAVSVIADDSCGPQLFFGSQLALGYDRSIYVAQSTSSDCVADAVYVYEHDASGNATPLRVLTGSATKLDQPTGIYVGE